jgi:hypothetical protein
LNSKIKKKKSYYTQTGKTSKQKGSKTKYSEKEQIDSNKNNGQKAKQNQKSKQAGQPLPWYNHEKPKTPEWRMEWAEAGNKPHQKPPEEKGKTGPKNIQKYPFKIQQRGRTSQTKEDTRKYGQPRR